MTKRRQYVRIHWKPADTPPDTSRLVLIHRPNNDGGTVWVGFHTGDSWQPLPGMKFDASMVCDWAEWPQPPY